MLNDCMPRPSSLIDTLPRPERRKNRLASHRVSKPGACLVPVDAQAACDFRCSASKCSPFFQSVNVMAAILRASVRRAISGFIPLASNPA